MSRKRYFIGIVIPSPLLEQIESIKQELLAQHGLKASLRSPAHITLHMPFQWEDEEALIERLRTFRFEERFDIVLRDFGFFEPRVIFIAVAQGVSLISLHEALTVFAKKELHIFNEADNMREYHPHVTVAFRDLKKRSFADVSAPFRERAFSGSFPYRGFSLLRHDDNWREIMFFDTR